MANRAPGLAAHELEPATWVPASGERLVGIGGTLRNLASAVELNPQQFEAPAWRAALAEAMD